MTAWIRTTSGEHTGRTILSIVRREYGRDAYVRWDGREANRGYIVAPAHRNDDARDVLDTLLDCGPDSDLGIERDYEAEAARRG